MRATGRLQANRALSLRAAALGPWPYAALSCAPGRPPPLPVLALAGQQQQPPPLPLGRGLHAWLPAPTAEALAPSVGRAHVGPLRMISSNLPCSVRTEPR